MSAYPNLARRHKIAYVGTYPPKECGIATFTLDVVNSTDLSGWRSIVFAVDDAAPSEPHPDSKVVYTIEKENRADYARAAKLLDKHRVSLLSIQHEYIKKSLNPVDLHDASSASLLPAFERFYSRSARPVISITDNDSTGTLANDGTMSVQIGLHRPTSLRSWLTCKMAATR